MSKISVIAHQCISTLNKVMIEIEAEVNNYETRDEIISIVNQFKNKEKRCENYLVKFIIDHKRTPKIEDIEIQFKFNLTGDIQLINDLIKKTSTKKISQQEKCYVY